VAGWGLAVEPGFEGAVVAFDLAARLGVVGAGVDQPGARAGDVAGEPGGAAAGEAGGERGAVVGQHQRGHAVTVEGGPDRGDRAGRGLGVGGVGGHQDPAAVIEDFEHGRFRLAR
jgi:hypothetical protein